MITVLITGAGGGVGQGIIKSLKLISDISIKIIAADMSPLAPGLYSADKSYLVPAAASPDYLSRLSEIFIAENVDYYFPGTDVELLFCAEYSLEIFNEYSVKVVVSPFNAIEISDDKYRTYQFLRENDLFFPSTVLGDKVELSEVEYPVIVKPRVGCRSIGVSIAKNEGELSARLENEENLVVQELIGTKDQEYTCTIVVVDGAASDVLILQRSLRSGDTFTANPVESSTVSDYVTKAALALGVEGSCNFQLRVDGDGIPKIFEINCRFSGTTPFCAQLGFNPVEYYLKKKMGLEYDYEVDFDAFVLRHWSEMVVKKEQIKLFSNDKKLVPQKISRSFL